MDSGVLQIARRYDPLPTTAAAPERDRQLADLTARLQLQAANPASPYAPPVVPKISGADAMRRRMETAPGCNIMLNVPCLQSTPMVGIGIPTN